MNKTLSQKIVFCCEQFNKNKTSKYFGVSWNTEKKKWKARLTYNQKQYYGGYFENEEHAAMKINFLCDKLEIERKNPTINLQPDETQQVFFNKYPLGNILFHSF